MQPAALHHGEVPLRFNGRHRGAGVPSCGGAGAGAHARGGAVQVEFIYLTHSARKRLVSTLELIMWKTGFKPLLFQIQLVPPRRGRVLGVSDGLYREVFAEEAGAAAVRGGALHVGIKLTHDP
jgi:hypothetical protein